MNNDEIKEIYDIINEKQYSSINKKINKNFQKFYLKKIKDNIHQKKPNLFDLFNVPKEKKNFENKFNYYNINLKKINTILKDLSSVEKFPNLKTNEPYYDYKKKKKVKLKVNKLVKRNTKKLNVIPISLSQITFSPGRYEVNYNSIYKKPFFPFFGKSNNFESKNSNYNIKKKIIVSKKSFSNQSFHKFKSISDSRNSKNISLYKNKFSFKKKFNTISDNINNNYKINKSRSNKLFSKTIYSENSFNFKNNKSLSEKNNKFDKSDNSFSKINNKSDTIFNKKFSCLVNYNKMIGRSNNHLYFKKLLNHTSNYNYIMPRTNSFKIGYKNSIFNLKKCYNNNYSNEY